MKSAVFGRNHLQIKLSFTMNVKNWMSNSKPRKSQNRKTEDSDSKTEISFPKMDKSTKPKFPMPPSLVCNLMMFLPFWKLNVRSFLGQWKWEVPVKLSALPSEWLLSDLCQVRTIFFPTAIYVMACKNTTKRKAKNAVILAGYLCQNYSAN